jgi:hypothetical protein
MHKNCYMSSCGSACGLRDQLLGRRLASAETLNIIVLACVSVVRVLNTTSRGYDLNVSGKYV